MTYLAWVISREAATPLFAQSPPLSYGMIKVVSNCHGLGLITEVILAAINPLGQCIVQALLSCLLCCLLLLFAHAPAATSPSDGSCEAPSWRVS